MGAATVGTVNGTADGTAVSATQIGSASLSSGQAGINYNFGDLKPVTVAGTVYEDKNDSGAFVSGDPLISGVPLTLSGTNGQGQSITATTTTGSGGTYSFTTDSNGHSLLPGTYQVVETAPSGYLLGAATVGTVNGTSDGAVVSATKIGSVALTSGQSGISYNFGNLKPVAVGGTVYEDTNDSGALVSGDPLLAGVTVTLSGTNDVGTSITATATTNASGLYSFTTDSSANALRPGTYAITETLPSGYLTRAATVGTVNGSADGSVVSATKVGSVVLAESQSGVSYNFGNLKPVTVGGTVYEDKNDSGAFVSGDPLIAGVTLTLSGTNDKGTSISATATTNSSGAYSFTTDSSGNALRPGTYAITETMPSGYLTRAATVGTVNGTSDGSVVSATQIGSVVLAESQSGVSYNFGNLKPVTVGGAVYEDKNDSGALVSGDPLLAGVTLTLSGTNDVGTSITATATTNASGVYSFTTDSSANALRPGTYTITETLPSGYLSGAATVGTVNGSADGSVSSATKISSVALAESQAGVNYYFGNLKPVTVGGTVYEDKNDSGALVSGDPLIAGVTVTLSGTNDKGTSIAATTTTSSGGTYNFTTDSNGNLLRPGTYAISETLPSGYLTRAATVGTVNGTSDGSVISATKIGSVVLTESQSGVSYNFGNLKPVTVGGTVYEDKNDSGALVSGDPPRGRHADLERHQRRWHVDHGHGDHQRQRRLQLHDRQAPATRPARHLHHHRDAAWRLPDRRRHGGHGRRHGRRLGGLGDQDQLRRAGREPGRRELLLWQPQASHRRRHGLRGQERQRRAGQRRSAPRGRHADLERHQRPGHLHHGHGHDQRQRRLQLHHRQQRQLAAAGHLRHHRGAAQRLSGHCRHRWK